ncbi:putative aldehyde oxidase 2 [Panicum miliaceum]|uniref:Aldehyde oxidase 2 n=1 Tax=Panicum miliaceum TaxID=4540 RepID=A0A3L6TS63_PANMI|nr:putative aldehyde oxidase 2 [Panicum miliaceum]
MGEAAVLAVNGERYEAAGVDPSTTLLEFLRTRTPVRGPKLGCGEEIGAPALSSSWTSDLSHVAAVQSGNAMGADLFQEGGVGGNKVPGARRLFREPRHAATAASLRRPGRTVFEEPLVPFKPLDRTRAAKIGRGLGRPYQAGAPAPESWIPPGASAMAEAGGQAAKVRRISGAC